MDPLSELPDDVRDEIAPHMPASPEMLAGISTAIAQKRDEAKAARTASGIEQTWKECEEAYVGIDDANRHEFSDARWSKPMSMDGPVTTGRKPAQTDYKSTVFVPLTARYVDAGKGKLAEILLPADDKAFSFSETPVPELIKAKEDTSQVVHDGIGNVPLTRAAKPGEVPPPPTPPVAPAVAGMPAPGAPGAPPPQVPLTVKDLAEEAIEIERKKAKLAETRIYDWMVESQYTAEARKVIFDAARLGVGVLKAPFPLSKRGIAVEKTGSGGIEVIIKDRIIPAVKWVDAWNIFPDPACGENIHNGDFCFERDYLSESQVKDLKKIPGYIGDQIDKVIEEGPDKAKSDGEDGGNSQTKSQRKGRFEVWYFYGTVKREEMDCICVAAGKEPGKVGDDAPKEVYAIVTLINTSVIRATINPLDSGKFPYHSVPWQRRAGHWAGKGVAEQIRTPQKMLNASIRAMLNNAGKSAGTQIVIDQAAIKPADNNWTITPDKIWYKMAESPGADVRQAFMAIVIPNVTDAMMKIIDLADKLAEDCTSIPLITQGQSGATTPDTFGATQLQNNNANQLLRDIGYAFDDYITEPVVREYYEWLLLDPDVPDDEKGEFTINAHGSIALVERAIQDQAIAQMGQMATQPIYGIDPKKWAKMFLKSKRLNPEDLQYTEEQQAKIDATPPPDPPPVAVAKIQASTAAEALAAKQGADQRDAANEQQIEGAAQILEGHKVDTERARIATEATVKLHDLAQRRELAMLDYANSHQISLAQAKVELAKTAMTLDTQKQLNAADNAVDLHRHATKPQKPPKTPPGAKPLAQVPGKAGNGQAMAQT